MAKKIQETTALQTREENTALARPAFLDPKDTRGAENIGTQDVRPPRLILAHGQHPQTKIDNAKYIEDLHELEMFNDLTNEIYGQGPIEFTVLKYLGKRFIEFNPMNEGGGVKDFDVKDGDPRTLFTEVTEGGKTRRIKPVATKFYDYLVLLLPSREIVALSLKGAQLKAATRLNSFIKLAQAPAFACRFTLESVRESKGGYNYGVFKIDRKGWVDEETFAFASKAHDTFAGKNIVIERDDENEEREPGSDDY